MDKMTQNKTDLTKGDKEYNLKNGIALHKLFKRTCFGAIKVCSFKGFFYV